jgi:aldose 1-epimerase
VQYRRVSDVEPILTLQRDRVAVTVYPDAGARIGQIVVAGRALLVDVPDPADRLPTMWGSFPMAPWAGRIRQGRFRFDGVDHQLPINHHDGPGPERSHAIHGIAFDRPWVVDTASDTSCTCSVSLDWEFAGTASQTIELFDDRVEVTLTVASTGAAFPAEIGWHPWFRKPDRLDVSPTAMYERDRLGLPTGVLVEPNDGPWDDCFLAAGPVVLTYDHSTAGIVTGTAATIFAITVTSDCDHWVIFDEPAAATCVEPQSGPPDAFNLTEHVTPHLVDPARPLTRRMSIAW